MTDHLLRVDFCCNDPDNGLFEHKVESIQICDSDPILELEASGASRRFRVESQYLFVSGKRAKWDHATHWFGNWCWDAYWLRVADAVELLEALHRRNLFHCTCGDARLFNRWDTRQPFDALTRRLFNDILERAAARQATRRA